MFTQCRLVRQKPAKNRDNCDLRKKSRDEFMIYLLEVMYFFFQNGPTIANALSTATCTRHVGDVKSLS